MRAQTPLQLSNFLQASLWLTKQRWCQRENPEHTVQNVLPPPPTPHTQKLVRSSLWCCFFPDFADFLPCLIIPCWVLSWSEVLLTCRWLWQSYILRCDFRRDVTTFDRLQTLEKEAHAATFANSNTVTSVREQFSSSRAESGVLLLVVWYSRCTHDQ